MAKKSSLDDVKTLDLYQMKSFIGELDRRLSRTTAETALVMLAAVKVGPDPRAISQFTGIPYPDVVWRSNNLEAAGIFIDGKVDQEWFNDDTAGAFWMDTLVAEGLLHRVFDDSPNRKYSLTDLGTAQAKALLRSLAIKR